MLDVTGEPSLVGDEGVSSQSSSNPRNTASLVGRAVHKTENKEKENAIMKATPVTVVEANGNTEADGILKEQIARLRKSSRPDSTGAADKPINGVDHDTQRDGIVTDHRARLHKSSQPESTGPVVSDPTNELDEVRQHLRHVNGYNDTDMNGNSYPPVLVENSEIYPRRNGYQSHNDSSSVSSSSYYGDIEDVTKEMYDLANGFEDARL